MVKNRNYKVYTIVFISFFALIISFKVFSYAQALERWESNDPYPNTNDINALIEATDGSIWAAGANGHTARWNGTQWEDKGQWPHGNNDIYALAAGLDGSIWAAGANGYIARWNGTQWEDKGQWPKGNSEIYALVVATDGSIWAVGYSVCKWDGQQWIVMDYYDNPITVATKAPNGIIWGAIGLNGEVINLETLETSRGWPYGTTSIFCMEVTSDGNVWVAGGPYSSVAVWDGQTWEDKGQWPYNHCLDLTEATDGSIWAAGSSGYTARWNGTEWEEKGQWPHGNANINVLITTSDGTVWAAGANGHTAHWATTTTPSLPGIPQLSVVLQDFDAVLSWTTSEGATSYIIERSEDNINFTQLTETSQISYTDSCLSPGTYYYRVKAKNETGVSGPSNIVSVTVLTPTSFKAYWDGNYVKVEWDRGDLDIQGTKFKLWRMDSNTNKWISIWDIGDINGFEYTDKWVLQGINYNYAIRSSDGLSEWYEWQTLAESGWATGDRPYQAPGGLRVSSYTDTTALVTWLPISGVTTYKVQISTDGGNTWQEFTIESPSVIVPCPCMMRVKAGTHERSQWSGVVRVKK